MNAVLCRGLGLLALSGLPLSGCSTPTESRSSTAQTSAASAAIRIDGSSTVYPLTDELVKELQFEKREGAPDITVAFSGTGGGFRKFCAGETEINNASRPILNQEMEACAANGVEYIELPVAFDALMVVVHGDNSWAEDITPDELKAIWEPGAEGTLTRWNQVRPSWPDRPLKLYGAEPTRAPMTTSLRRLWAKPERAGATIRLSPTMGGWCERFAETQTPWASLALPGARQNGHRFCGRSAHRPDDRNARNAARERDLEVFDES